MSDPVKIDVTNIAGHNSPSSRLARRWLGERENGDHLLSVMPDGEVELTWTLEECEDFMKAYLEYGDSMERRYQNRRKWNYPIWRFIMQEYAEGLTYKQIAAKVIEHFECYQLPGSVCTQTTIKKIVWYRDWKIGQRMKMLLAQDKFDAIMSAKTNAAIKAQELELDIVQDLRREYRACANQLKGMEPGTKEYTATVSAMSKIADQISKISGTDSIRKLDEFREKEAIRGQRKPTD